jgi:hypothetical protein
MIGTDLAGLPAGDGEIAVAVAAEDFLDVLLRIELGLFGKAEDLHCSFSVSVARDGACQSATMRRECGKARRKVK